jgi:hypothetical protein
MMRRTVRSSAVTLLGLLLAASAAPDTAEANWLTKILENAGEIGSKGAPRGAQAFDRDLGRAVGHVKALPETTGAVALAAEAGAEGHWRFVNRSGEVYTAGTADELLRVRDALLPGGTGRLSLYLTPDTVFAQRALLGDLPADAELFIATRTGSHRILREAAEGGDRLYAEVRPGLRARLDSEDLFIETLVQLGQPLKPASLRIIALETGSADALTAVPRFDSATRMALIDRIDPHRLAGALHAVRGQTVVLTGRIEGNALMFVDAAGGEGALALDAVRQAARAADVNLLFVRAGTPRQPGGRNWLWQTAGIPGLDTALKQPTFGDFLVAIGPKDVPLTVTALRAGSGRVILEAVPPAGPAAPLTDTLTGWVDALAGDVMARIAVAGFEADLRDAARQVELDRRILPGIPSALQIGYLVAFAMGLLGLATAWRWWARIWPPEERGDYASGAGYAAARSVRTVLFGLVFLPLAGLPLVLRLFGLQVWTILTAPARALRWLRDRLAPRPG